MTKTIKLTTVFKLSRGSPQLNSSPRRRLGLYLILARIFTDRPQRSINREYNIIYTRSCLYVLWHVIKHRFSYALRLGMFQNENIGNMVSEKRSTVAPVHVIYFTSTLHELWPIWVKYRYTNAGQANNNIHNTSWTSILHVHLIHYYDALGKYFCEQFSTRVVYKVEKYLWTPGQTVECR